MKDTNKKSIIIILTILTLAITPIFSKASSINIGSRIDYQQVKNDMSTTIQKPQLQDSGETTRSNVQKEIGGQQEKGKTNPTTGSTSGSSPIRDPDQYQPGGPDSEDIKPVTEKAGIVVNVFTTVGIIASVIVLIILGIKYMIGSIEERAEYKKAMVPYIVGAIMLMGTSTIVMVISNITSQVLK